MAISKKDFPIFVDTCINTESSYNKFYLDFTHNKKRVRKLLDYTDNNWDKKTRIRKARAVLDEMKEKLENSGTGINLNSTLDQIAQIYFEKREKTKWTEEMIQIYNLHLATTLGKKKVSTIKTVDIDRIAIDLKSKGKTNQTKNGCSARTIQKILKNVLKPILEYAYNNDIITKVPHIEAPSVNNKPKPVKDAHKAFMDLYKAIMNIYLNDPFYRGIFLFCLYGRRQNEIFTLEWDAIDFDVNTYTIKSQHNKIKQDQTYTMPLQIRQALEDLGKKEEGLIFASPITGKKLTDIRTQVKKISEATNIPQLTMHYFRNVISSYLASRPDITPNMLAASLGHLDLQTAQHHYITKDHTKASQAINDIIYTTIEEDDKK